MKSTDYDPLVPLGGSISTYFEAVILAIPTDRRIILFERHSKERIALEALKHRFGYSREKTRQLQLAAERELLNWARHPSIQIAQKQLSTLSDGYAPNSGEIPLLDGNLQKIRQYSRVLNWALKYSVERVTRGSLERMYFDIDDDRWKIFALS